MGMKPAKNRNRALFEEVGVETPRQMPVKPQGGMIDARPKGARGAVRLWMASLILLALLMLGFDTLPIPEPVAQAAPFTGAAVLAVWALGALGLAMGRKFPRGWAGRSFGLGAFCLLVFVSDPAVFSMSAKALRGDVAPVAATVLPATEALPPLPLLPAAPPTAAPGALAPDPAGSPGKTLSLLDQARALGSEAAQIAADQIGGMRELIGPPVLAALRAGLAFLITGFGFWYVLLLGRSEAELISARRQGEAGLAGLATGLMHLGFAQLLIGALTTALGAGAVHMDWPLMGGAFFPTDALTLEPLWRNALENPALVQFLHRVAGYLILLLGLVALIRSRRSVHGVTRAAFLIAVIWLVLQVVLGVVTLLRADAQPLALAHLGVAVLVWVFVIRARFLARYPRVQSIRRS
ncbi:COX15/CtaA family protein [Rhodobacter maris]|uniref:Cytochrome c oxidase assembly protein subunit 15 n=1 Tax=Rhodobacter maris TaxID=446682 RepID=A0A285RXJ8_9RHOB|nr:COX15/CtaA family protein [Rhodobacter maris]SOB99013.1 cytochrome c oxidase assembly protein subunit 15 [Rhodobacter maris]